MRIDKLITARDNHPEIIWHETRTETIDQQLHPERYREEIVNQKRVGRVLFVEKKLFPKSQ